MDYFLIFSEGIHDQALLQKILETAFDFKKFSGQVQKLDPFWRPLIANYPVGGNLYARVPFPSICLSSSISVAIYVVEGDNLFEKIEAISKSFKPKFDQLKGCVFCGDAETQDPQKKFIFYKERLYPCLANLPNQLGKISDLPPYQGIYFFPDNKFPGTLEDILLKCADCVCSDLKSGAEHYINHISSDRKAKWSKNDGKKALVGCISNILRPGKTNQVSIANDDWVSKPTLVISELKSLIDFLSNLFQKSEVISPN